VWRAVVSYSAYDALAESPTIVFGQPSEALAIQSSASADKAPTLCLRGIRGPAAISVRSARALRSRGWFRNHPLSPPRSDRQQVEEHPQPAW
jgi:hypothetical protein